jgi:exodeoxyribonuclease V gamma subunit
VLVDLYDRGMREPPPLFCLTSAAYARAARDERDPVAAARAEWLSEWNRDREDREAEHTLVLGGVAAFEDLLAEPARDDERGPGWDTSEPSRFGRTARRLWDGLLDHEQVDDR